MEISLAMLNTEQFRKLNSDLTRTTDRKLRRILRKIKSNLFAQEYSLLYATGSSPVKFHGTSKIHKITEKDSVDSLPIRPIISNTGTTTYHLAKYLAKILSPLSKSQ